MGGETSLGSSSSSLSLSSSQLSNSTSTSSTSSSSSLSLSSTQNSSSLDRKGSSSPVSPTPMLTAARFVCLEDYPDELLLLQQQASASASATASCKTWDEKHRRTSSTIMDWDEAVSSDEGSEEEEEEEHEDSCSDKEASAEEEMVPCTYREHGCPLWVSSLLLLVVSILSGCFTALTLLPFLFFVALCFSFLWLSFLFPLFSSLFLSPLPLLSL